MMSILNAPNYLKLLQNLWIIFLGVFYIVNYTVIAEDNWNGYVFVLINITHISWEKYDHTNSNRHQ